MVKFYIHHILAYGCNRSYMFIYYEDEPDKIIVCHITRQLYFELKSKGVPTSQSLRYKK